MSIYGVRVKFMAGVIPVLRLPIVWMMVMWESMQASGLERIVKRVLVQELQGDIHMCTGYRYIAEIMFKMVVKRRTVNLILIWGLISKYNLPQSIFLSLFSTKCFFFNIKFHRRL